MRGLSARWRFLSNAARESSRHSKNFPDLTSIRANNWGAAAQTTRLEWWLRQSSFAIVETRPAFSTRLERLAKAANGSEEATHAGWFETGPTVLVWGSHLFHRSITHSSTAPPPWGIQW